MAMGREQGDAYRGGHTTPQPRHGEEASRGKDHRPNATTRARCERRRQHMWASVGTFECAGMEWSHPRKRPLVEVTVAGLSATPPHARALRSAARQPAPTHPRQPPTQVCLQEARPPHTHRTHLLHVRVKRFSWRHLLQKLYQPGHTQDRPSATTPRPPRPSRKPQPAHPRHGVSDISEQRLAR